MFSQVCLTLLDVAKETFEGIVWGNQYDFDDAELMSPTRFVDLKGFEALKHIELDEVFINGALVDALPASTESLRLIENTAGPWWWNRQLFDGLVELKRERLPFLTKLVYEDWRHDWIMEGYSQRRIRKVGLRLECEACFNVLSDIFSLTEEEHDVREDEDDVRDDGYIMRDDEYDGRDDEYDIREDQYNFN